MSRSRSKGGQTSSSGISFLWQDSIPSELLSKVFEYLTQEDRLNVRLTCRRWSDVCMLEPRFWESHVFNIKARDDGEVDRILGYLQTFGGHLKHLFISLELQTFNKRSGNRRKTTKVQSQRVFSELKELLNTNYQLNSFTFDKWAHLQDFQTDQIPFDSTCIHRALCSMLNVQQHLSDVYFFDFNLSKEEGCEVLDALNSQLISLTLRNFFNGGPTVYSMPVFLEVIGRFNQLESIGVTYCTLSDKLLERLNNASPSFKRVLMYVDDEDIETPFSPPDWRKAVKKNPMLGVNVIMYIDFEQFPYQVFLLRQMPLIRLTISLDFDEDTDGDWTDDAVERELIHATRFITHHRLSSFILAFEKGERGPWNRPEALVALVKACPFLGHLCLDMTLTQETLEQVAAAAYPKEAGGHSARPALQIHVKDCDTSLERVMERVSALNPLCKVHTCFDFERLNDIQPARCLHP